MDLTRPLEELEEQADEIETRTSEVITAVNESDNETMQRYKATAGNLLDAADRLSARYGEITTDITTPKEEMAWRDGFLTALVAMKLVTIEPVAAQSPE